MIFPEQGSAYHRVPGTLLLRVFLPFAGGYFLSYLYRTVNAVISPDLVTSLGLGATDLGLLTSVYFLTFALFQLPLGMLLDHFGPRRVEAALLLVAAAGAMLFSLSDHREGLILGRALIGLGVSACLMASFKAFVMWFPVQRLPAVNGWVMAMGGLGALTATAPVEMALHFTDWRGLFAGLATITFMTAGIVFWVVPERSRSDDSAWRQQWQGVAQVFSSHYFWRLAPLTMCSQAAFLSIQGLWAGPWLKDVANLDRSTLATYLLATAAAMVAGYLLMGTLTYRLNRLGITPMTVAGSGMSVFMLTQLGLTLGFTDFALVLWMLFGFFGTSGILTYAVLSQAFPTALAGRTNTAVNLLVFMAAFIGQWGIGAVINLWPMEAGEYHPHGYRAAFGLVLGLQLLGFLWFLMPVRQSPADQSRAPQGK